MSESTTPAQCRDEDWKLARNCGLMCATPGTSAWDAALGRFADALRQPQPTRFQARVQPWMLECFGAEIATDAQERNHRFLEEALELVQACGATASEAHQLVDYVYGRPVGEKTQEAGGVMVTLAALCLAQGLDMHAAGETELARIWTKVEQIRAKQAAKPKHSPLPEHPRAAPQCDMPGYPNRQPDGSYPGCDVCACGPGQCHINATLRAAGADDARDAEHKDIGRLLHKAAGALPDGWEVQVRVERGWGGVVLHDPDGETTDLDDGETSLSEQVERAIDAALRASKEGA